MAEAKAKLGIECRECGHVEPHYLGDHLLEVHSMTVQEYLGKYPDAPTASKELLTRFGARHKNPRRATPLPPNELTVNFSNVKFSLHADVPEDSCLPMPPHYRLPEHGKLSQDIQHAVVALSHHRSIYVWGMPGSGKDALFHAWSAATRTPAIIRQVTPGSDIESWFFTRAFNEQGTYWEEGEVLTALRDGYLTVQGERIPYLFLVTDFDRATREQAEHLRLITDSIQGRVSGAAGKTHKVLPGTIVAVTGNTSGSGDDRGRMISANPIDGSILDRFERKFQFRWMDWKDEEIICKDKFPVLVQRCPSVFRKLGAATVALRESILNGDLYAEFSHRGVCSILGHAQDMLECQTGRKVPANLLKMAARAWLDGLPDEESRGFAKKAMDPHFATLDEGDTSHVGSGGVASGYK